MGGERERERERGAGEMEERGDDGMSGREEGEGWIGKE
jgi:hypothetical protein